ncbi:uncharacterized protein MAM_04628 [Metarhizium album ARSEF 1941]|uniref:YMC020W-like alpha/beta hydrolase domain-containing protein n=1 Tax=Metarhizium album (strain ARSEF 1941) TaxID=1081103 RepID=A0A0B2WU66_METAS|nr:uncharacterized protein MAM_04628 [Metarhizium album ARSEF 1941]KHN97613.1 hypothetical protein MAM_04628 [Metarhizium album ARSEF 1941]
MLPRKRQRPDPANASSTSRPTTALSRETATSLSQSRSRLAAVAPRLRETTESAASTLEAANNTWRNVHVGPRQPLPLPPPIPPIPPSLSTHPRGANSSDSVAQRQIRKAKSWYGSWPKTPRKAAALTSVARENISGGTVRSTAAPDLGRFDTFKKRVAETDSIRRASPSDFLSKVFQEDMPAVAAAADRTTPHENAQHAKTSAPKSPRDPGELRAAQDTEQNDSIEPRPEVLNSTTALPATEASSPPPSGWLFWWSKAPAAEQQTFAATPAALHNTGRTTPDDRPFTPPAQTAPSDSIAREPPPSAPAASSTWRFGFWSSTDNNMNKTDPEKEGEPAEDQSKQQQDVFMENAPAPAAADVEGQPTPKAGSTWAFWSRASPSKSSNNETAASESGEMAVIGEGSEAHPKRMSEGEVSSPQGQASKQDTRALKSTWRRKKRARAALPEAATDSDASTATRSTIPANEAPQGLPPPPKEQKTSASSLKADSASTAAAESETVAKQPPNLLLPSFTSTYQMKENPSIIQQIAQLLLRTSQPPANHVFRTKDPPKIRKAIAIGIHGLFPATYLRPMIGQPTGTSLRFANLCAEAIRRWTDAHGSPECEIEKVALEGDGRISDRVDNLWKLMLNWIDHIRKADFIILACHSQGVPVSIMLLDKLIDMGVITNAKIGVCAMAGVALGPFPDYKSSILMGSAAELWDFGNPQSSNSQRLEASLRRVLHHGARVTFIGSIDDQLVPMASAVYSPASHPYIYRAVFIDGRIHAPDFIAHLVGFALKLRNLGVSDHGLVRELSVALAGSLYSGEGHSRLYFDPAVYDLAISHALETTSVSCPVTWEFGPREGVASANPYVLPWIMRGMLEEDFVKTELSSETEDLLRQFDDWKPSNKALKDVKYRLEAIRSRL